MQWTLLKGTQLLSHCLKACLCLYAFVLKQKLTNRSYRDWLIETWKSQHSFTAAKWRVYMCKHTLKCWHVWTVCVTHFLCVCALCYLSPRYSLLVQREVLKCTRKCPVLRWCSLAPSATDPQLLNFTPTLVATQRHGPAATFQWQNLHEGGQVKVLEIGDYSKAADRSKDIVPIAKCGKILKLNSNSFLNVSSWLKWYQLEH